MSLSVRRKLPAMLSSLLVLGSVGTAQAADRFVSPTGSDTANDCLSSASPCRTVQRAVSQAASGDSIKLAKGRYAGPVTIATPPSITLTLLGGWSTDFSTRDVQRNKTAVRGGPEIGSTFVVGAGSGGVVDVTLDGLTLINGRAGAVAAMSSDDGSLTLSLSDCILRGNKSTVYLNGGGISAIAHNTSSLQLAIADSILQGNRSVYSRFGGSGGPGGGITAESLEMSSIGLMVTRSLFLRNRTDAVGGGGAIDAVAASSSAFDLTVVDSTFLGNTARDNGGAIAFTSSSSGSVNVDLTNNLFAGNKAKTGGGGGLSIGVFGAPGTTLNITNCTFAANVAGNSGGGLELDSTPLTTLTNTIVWGNHTHQPFPSADDVAASAATVDIDHSDIGHLFSNGGSINDLGGNISVDPLLVNPPTDLHLRAGSPCIDAGTCIGAPTTDFEGDPRPSGASCDIGADEFVP